MLAPSVGGGVPRHRLSAAARLGRLAAGPGGAVRPGVIEAGRRTTHQDWYAAGLATTCRWMAHGVLELNGRRVPVDAPVSHRSSRAYEELIEAELLAAEKLALQRPVPAWLAQRPGWCEAVCATLRWAWRRNGPPPLRVPASG